MSVLAHSANLVSFVPTNELKHIEAYSPKRVKWLAKKIQKEQMWTKPICVEKNHKLVLDGQHRMEMAKLLGLQFVPCVLFDYTAVKIWSLRDNYFVDHETVISRSLSGDIYPYKTVKHQFPIELPQLTLSLNYLMQLEAEAV